MSKHHEYHIPHRATTIATYWLVQWGAITAIVWYMMVVRSVMFGTPVDFANAVIPGLLWTCLCTLLQLTLLAAPDQIGGRRERSRLRAYLSIGACAACAAGLWALVLAATLAYAWFAEEIPGLVLLLAVLAVPGTIVCFVYWLFALRSLVRKGQLERQYHRIVSQLLGWTVMCAIVCAALAAGTTIVGQNVQHLRIGFATVPWLFSATIALVGCRIYLKRLWIARTLWYETHCAECGYDMTGSLAVTQCSECGTPGSPQQTSAPARAVTAQNV